jgi:hypothetical protein
VTAWEIQVIHVEAAGLIELVADTHFARRPQSQKQSCVFDRAAGENSLKERPTLLTILRHSIALEVMAGMISVTRACVVTLTLPAR